MSSGRKSAVRTYNRFYRAITQPACVYCGLRATTKDHFVPISVVSMLIECADMHEGLFLLPSCGECNSIASDNIFKTVAAKRRFIQARLRKKYKKLLAMSDWKENEMEDVGWSIESFVRSGMAQKALLLQRLAWRNTKNSSFVSIAKIRSGVLGHGQSFVRVSANNNTPTKREKGRHSGDVAG